MASTLKLEIVTPEARTFSEDVEMVTLPAAEGEMGIFPQHVPLMTQIVAGEVIARKDGRDVFLAVGDGFVEITGELVAIMTDMAIRAENIDEAKADKLVRDILTRIAPDAKVFTPSSIEALGLPNIRRFGFMHPFLKQNPWIVVALDGLDRAGDETHGGDTYEKDNPLPDAPRHSGSDCGLRHGTQGKACRRERSVSEGLRPGRGRICP